jgi:iron complex outermembrane receptor protein
LDRVVLNYFDPSINTKTYSTVRRWIGSADVKYPVSQHFKIKGELRGGLTGVETNNYAGLKTRRHFSALLNPDISFLERRLHIYPALRFDWYSDFGGVVSPSLGLNYALIRNKLYLRGQLSRNFNPPTFNELYWEPTGDPNLKPERSKNAQAGIAAILSDEIVHKIDISGFYNRVHNGFRWYPNDVGTFKPVNIQDILSRGIKLNTVSDFHPGAGFNLNFSQTGQLTRTEIVKPRFPVDEGVGHQMRYIPEWRYKAGLMIQKSIFTALINYRWTGRRYVTETESRLNSLDPYQRVDVVLQARKSWLGLTFSGNLQVNNLFNANYAIIQWFAMPRRNVQFTLTITHNF